jgi:hypothetical protein
MNFQNRSLLTILFISTILLLSCRDDRQKNAQTSVLTPEISWPITSYNFGKLEELIIPDQIALLSKSGYKGLILKSESKKDFDNFDEYLRVTESTDNFKVDAVFEIYKSKYEAERRERWKLVVDRIAGKGIQLWMIFGKDGFDDVFIENKIREIVAYATLNKVEVILYPHSGTYFESSEEALVFADKIDHPNLKLAFHLYHDIRAGHGSRIPEVFENIKHRLSAVTLAGTDSIADFTTKFTRDTTTIKPLGRGNYDMNNFVEILSNSGYTGSVGFMNFKLKHPTVYLPKSKEIWDKLLLNL